MFPSEVKEWRASDTSLLADVPGTRALLGAMAPPTGLRYILDTAHYFTLYTVHNTLFYPVHWTLFYPVHFINDGSGLKTTWNGRLQMPHTIPTFIPAWPAHGPAPAKGTKNEQRPVVSQPPSGQHLSTFFWLVLLCFLCIYLFRWMHS